MVLDLLADELVVRDASPLAGGNNWKARCDVSCEGCDGGGVRCPAGPSCSFVPGDVAGRVLVEKCDSCDRFADDLAAAQTVFSEARWVTCTQGGQHAIGRGLRVKSGTRCASEGKGEMNLTEEDRCDNDRYSRT